MAFSVVASCLLLACCAAPAAAAAAPAKSKVVIVADVGVDDAAGLLWALAASDRLEVLGVMASFGCHYDVRVTARNARLLLATANRSDIPVFEGSRWALGAHEMPETDGTLFHGKDGFGGLDDETMFIGSGGAVAEAEEARLSEGDLAAHGQSAAEFLVQAAREYPGEITVLCFSPLTNLALALMLEPTLPALLKGLILMGGAVWEPGNVSPLAEANFNHDAAAAKVVVQGFAGSIVLVPLDVTHKLLLSHEDMDFLSKSSSKSAQLLAKVNVVYGRAYCEVSKLCHGRPVHDALPVGYMLYPELYTASVDVPMEIVVSRIGQPEHGMSLVDQRPRAATQCSVAARAAGQCKLGSLGWVTVLRDINVPQARSRILKDIVKLA